MYIIVVIIAVMCASLMVVMSFPSPMQAYLSISIHLKTNSASADSIDDCLYLKLTVFYVAHKISMKEWILFIAPEHHCRFSTAGIWQGQGA